MMFSLYSIIHSWFTQFALENEVESGGIHDDDDVFFT